MHKNIFKIDPDQDLSFISKLTSQLTYDKRAESQGVDNLYDKMFGCIIIATVFIEMPLLNLLNHSGHVFTSFLFTIVWCLGIIFANSWSLKHEKKSLASFVIDRSGFNDMIVHKLGLDNAPVFDERTQNLLNSISELNRFAYIAGAGQDVKDIADDYSELTMLSQGLNKLVDLGRVSGENFDKINAKYEELLEKFRNEIFNDLIPDFNNVIAFEIKNGNTDFLPNRIKKALAKIYAYSLLDEADD